MPYLSLKSASLDLPKGHYGLKDLFKRSAKRGSDARLSVNGTGAYCRALENLNIEIGSGERVGVIGANGAGKSTLLRVLAGIYAPTEGEYFASGRASTLFTANLGMNPNASGEENIFLSARTLGLSRAEIANAKQDIIDFVDLGDFINMPLRTYSAGMKMRLGFAVATALQPEILLVDEVFGTGDASFQKRAKERITNLMSRAGILVLATHSNSAIREFCDRVIWLENGKIKFDGEAGEGIKQFSKALTKT